MNIGFMGGTFSPPHKGHLHSAKVFIEEMKLSKLIIIPAGTSPFKADDRQTASVRDRLCMASLCFSCLDSDKCSVKISTLETDRGGTSYTVDTLKQLKQLYPGDRLFMFVGSDMFLSLERWKSFEEIFSLCTVYTRCREIGEQNLMQNTADYYTKKYGARIYLSDDKEIIASSTLVREALHTKNIQSCQNLLTDEVLRYIIRGGLYFES